MQAERVEAYFIMLCIHWRGILYHQPCHVPISKYLYDISCGLSIHYPKTQYIAGRKRRSLDHINKEKLIIRRLNLINNLTKFFLLGFATQLWIVLRNIFLYQYRYRISSSIKLENKQWNISYETKIKLGLEIDFFLEYCHICSKFLRNFSFFVENYCSTYILVHR